MNKQKKELIRILNIQIDDTLNELYESRGWLSEEPEESGRIEAMKNGDDVKEYMSNWDYDGQEVLIYEDGRLAGFEYALHLVKTLLA